MIYGYEYSYRELLEWTNSERLEVRREKRVKIFPKNCIKGRFGKLVSIEPVHQRD